VGSGFGGTVAAARLAQAGFAILERDRRWQRGIVPPGKYDLKAGWLWPYQVQRHAAHQEHLGNQSHSASSPSAMAPNLGQGANSALVDGMVLAEELAGAPSVMDALTGYDTRRRPLARRVQKTAAMLQRLCGIEQVTTLRVRDALLAGLAPFPRLSEEGIRRALGRRRPNCQIGIPARRRPLSRPSRRKVIRVDVARSDGQP
jgi:hypothetical protein